MTFYSIPSSSPIIIPISITPCEAGFLGYNELPDGSDFVCLEINEISSPAVIAISIVTAILIVATIILMALLYWKREDPVIKRAQVVFCELVAFGALLCYVSIYMWVTSASTMCILRKWLLGVGVTIILAYVSNLSVKLKW